MRVAKTLFIIIVLGATVLSGDNLPKLYAADNITENNVTGIFQSERKTSAFILARMDEGRKKQPMQSDEPGLPVATCMDLYQNFYENYGRRNSPPPPSGTTSACLRCLTDRREAGRPWSDAAFYCRNRCCP